MKYDNSFMRIIWNTEKWATIVELMVVLAILWLGITALLQTLSASINFAQDTENNIKAINIAREWIEWVTNIRDTNWNRFSSDKINCWKVKNYSSACVGENYATNSIYLTGWSSTIYSQNGLWYLSGILNPPNPWTNWSIYKNIYQVWLDSNWFYTQTGVSATSCSVFNQKSCKTLFTREVILTVPNNSTGVLMVKSTARWFDRRPQSVTLETTLTNWKSNF